MIVTDDFVFLNYPRTGSTFVREALRDVYAKHPERRFEELVLPNSRTLTARRQRRMSQHGSRHQIPAGHEDKPVFSVVRHPLDRLVSQFALAFWSQGNDVAPVAELRSRFPSYPKLSFGEFLDYHGSFAFEDVRQGAELMAHMGTETLHFVRFYARDPAAALAELTDEAIENDAAGFSEGVRFLRNESLAADLRAILAEVGFDQDKTRFIEGKAHSNAARSRRGRTWREYFSPDEESAFRVRERLLFRLFPEYDERPHE